jgi:predicted dehydrogenase
MPVTFGLVGTGWRADFFLRLARILANRFTVTAVLTRDPAKGATIESAWSLPTVQTADELATRYRPDFIVASVNRTATPSVIQAFARHRIPVLAETPPATDLADMRDLWSRLPDPSLVQVAEQYPYLPKMQVYRTLIESGRLGPVTAAQVSWTHGYHAVALLRGLLGVGFREATVTAHAIDTPIQKSLSRDGWPEETTITSATRTIAMLDFDGLAGVYDFTDGQWFHPLMGRRITVRGVRGEIIDDQLTTLLDARTPVRSTLTRRQTGLDGDLEGFDLDTIAVGFDVLYRNPFPGARLSDEDIAIASVLDRMARWAKDEADPPYPLAEACQDHLLALAITESAAKRQPVRVPAEAWSRS